ncbi:hypothetical protein J3R30DRAFT_3309846 [Lentinula aciculospora]|uniref:PPM-type phosphatase domain-containing protein n=1 Tax=Lentinula aciculospora TaxID=153920 RepID=A0A9W8ZV61_9AGAR|nr:hypothetical protein J3R30DRAFT_3309846 [Lentinula aciculospora]
MRQIGLILSRKIKVRCRVLGWLKEHTKFQRARYAVVGTTALISFVDRAKENVWVASLGDSDACQKSSEDGTDWAVTCFSDSDNSQNPKKVERVQNEHPNEPEVNQYGRVLACLAVTQGGFQDRHLKSLAHLAKNILRYMWPSPFPLEVLENCVSPPYLSTTPVVRHHPLEPSDILVLSSDGLAYELRDFDEDNKERLVVSFSMASHLISASKTVAWSEKLGHELILAEDSNNPAEMLIKNVCFGMDLAKMAEAVNPSQEWDDISALVLQL